MATSRLSEMATVRTVRDELAEKPPPAMKTPGHVTKKKVGFPIQTSAGISAGEFVRDAPVLARDAETDPPFVLPNIPRQGTRFMNMPEHTTQDSLESTPTPLPVDEIRSISGSPRPLQRGSTADEVLRNPRIAIVDDEPINVETVREHLRMAGYRQFFTTSDSTKAMDLIRQERPDIVLLDIMMPHVSGLDILDELRGSDDFFDLPVIILTAATDREMKLKALESGATEFLTKPLDSVELLVRLKNVLGMKAHFDRIKDYVRDLEHEVETITGGFDAAIDNHPSESALSPEACPAVRKEHRGTVFDPAAVDALFDRIDQVLQVCREHQG